MKPALIVKSNASQAPVTKKTESLTPLAANKFRSKNTFGSAMKERTATNGFSSRSSERVEKRKEVHKLISNLSLFSHLLCSKMEFMREHF